MTDPDATVSIDQLKGAIGSLLFLCSDIERALQRALQAESLGSPARPVRGLYPLLEAFASRVIEAGDGRPLQTDLCQRLVRHLREATLIRNLICHGLVGYSVRTIDPPRDAHLLVELETERREIGWAELQAMFEWMSRCRWLIEALTAAALNPDPVASEHSLRGWVAFSEQP